MSDLIYRQDAINAMMALQAEDDEAYGCHIPEGFDGERAKEALEQLPSAQPERKKGKWIEEIGMLMCSECGDAWGTEQFDEVMSFNFCPNCGAKMEEEE